MCFFKFKISFGSEKNRFYVEFRVLRHKLRAFTTDATGQLDVLGHNGHTFGMDSAQVGVFEETNQVSLTSFLQGHHGRTLEA